LLDLAVATGRGPDVLADLEGLRPLVRDEDVARAPLSFSPAGEGGYVE
jgi:hypothetical protein